MMGFCCPKNIFDEFLLVVAVTRSLHRPGFSGLLTATARRRRRTATAICEWQLEIKNKFLCSLNALLCSFLLSACAGCCALPAEGGERFNDVDLTVAKNIQDEQQRPYMRVLKTITK
jgi:hypothetical protein